MSPSAEAVLATLVRAERPLTRLELMAATRLSPSAISNGLAELQAQGLATARSLGKADHTRGRPRNVYAYRPHHEEPAP